MGCFGGSWGDLGFCEVFDVILGVLEAILGCFGVLCGGGGDFGVLGVSWGCSWGGYWGFWGVLGFLGCFWVVLGVIWGLLR